MTATLTLTTQQEAVVIPAIAVQVNPEGQIVFGVKPDMTVESRTVSPGVILGDTIVIEKGLSADEMVVIEGQMMLVPGTKVQSPGASTLSSR